MKNDLNNIDEIIRNLLKTVNVPKKIFSEAYLKLKENKQSNGINVIKYVACFSIICCILIYIVIFINKNNNSLNNENNANNENETPKYASQKELPIASYSINLNGTDNIAPRFMSPMGLDIIKEESDCIAVVKLNKVLYYTNYASKVNLYSQIALTVSNVSIVKNFKGNLSDNLEIMSVGGILSISNFEKACFPEQIQKHGFDKMSQEEKENTYIETINLTTISLPKLDEEKYYLVYLKYSDNFEKYQVLDQFLYEYDINNDTIKNIDTSEWIKFIYD